MPLSQTDLDDIARQCFDALGRGTEDGLIEVITYFHKPNAEAVGADLVVNGTFTGHADGWTVPAGFQYSTNAVQHASDGTGALAQAVPVQADIIYQVRYTVSGWVVGTAQVALGGTPGKVRTGAGAFQEDLAAVNTGALTLTPSATARWAVDNVSVKQTGTVYPGVDAWFENYRGNEIDGELILRDDQKGRIPQSDLAFAPTQYDELTRADGTRWRVMRPSEGRGRIWHILQLRRVA